jgi:hypothetical protein
MMEAVSSSETSVNLYQTTRRNIPEDSQLQPCMSSEFCFRMFVLHDVNEHWGVMFLRLHVFLRNYFIYLHQIVVNLILVRAGQL